jgi:anti-sigma factor RsiW
VNCHQALPLIAAYVDGEVDRLQRLSIEKHLRACAGCAAERESLLSLRARIRAEVPYFTAPPALRERLETVLEVTPAVPAPRPRPAGNRWRWLSAGALAGCMATILAWFVGAAVIDWRANDDLASEAVASHVRATLGNHLIEIASSDQHTVKPWLSARLDYSPPVRDLANEGFALVGGRLDSLDHRPVAVLVYRYRQHTIDVFVRPRSASRLPLRALRGFNVAQATGADMDWIAVSDVSADVLSSFVARLAIASTGP